jgi:glucosylceramidase
MIYPSRRRFLQQAPLATAFLACSASHGSLAQSLSGRRPQAWITQGSDRVKPLALPAWSSDSAVAADSILLDPAQTAQSLLGFGGAFTDASCYLFSRMTAGKRQALLQEFFGNGGLNLSVGRTCIGSSDYSRNAYSFDDADAPDPELKHFSIAHDQAYILPTLREARAIQPDLFLLASPWSPPGWMKSANTLLGGTMYKKYMAAYAQYFVRYIQEYRAAGIPIGAVTSQNESDTNQDGHMPACLWGQEYEAEFIRDHLGPALRRAGLDTRIWLLDHNYDLWGRVLDQLSDPALAAFVDGVAWHGYAGTPELMSKVHEAHPGKSAYWTEGGDFYDAADYLTDWAKWSSTFTGILRNWARCIITWNLVLDEKGQPNIGPFNCGGLITQNSQTGEISRSGLYWALAHYSKFVQRDARVVSTRGEIGKISHVAFKNPDGSLILVLTNQGRQRDVAIRVREQALHLESPADSIITLQWQ